MNCIKIFALMLVVCCGLFVVQAANASDLCEPGPNRKVTLCHIPPGNPGNAHTISVGVKAVRAHLRHGDVCGPCEALGCFDDDDCAPGQICYDGECVTPTGTGCQDSDECDDGNECTTDFCNPALGCQHQPIDTCSDGDPCTIDSCDPDVGCVSVPINCEDGNPCTIDECVGGQCNSAPIDCPEGEVCEDGVCLPLPECEEIEDCDDADPCTIDECVEGECVSVDIVCDDDDPCTMDDCVDGECLAVEIDCPEGEVCEDGECVPVPEEIQLMLDIKPHKCPNTIRRGTNAAVWVGLLGSDEVDITEIDWASVLLVRADLIGEGVTPTHKSFKDVGTPFAGELCDCHGFGKDGMVDLRLKFKTGDLEEGLELGALSVGSTLELVLVGWFLDGTPFAASDCVKLVQ